MDKAREAALRIARGNEQSGDYELVANNCVCLFCCDRRQNNTQHPTP